MLMTVKDPPCSAALDMQVNLDELHDISLLTILPDHLFPPSLALTELAYIHAELEKKAR